ncbi:MAG: hypothetical protein VYD86_11270, partial [Verrucomicrobiota bacterium]|nr:hypothetical protein [Verrucomicrobiota bacterium]
MEFQVFSFKFQDTANAPSRLARRASNWVAIRCLLLGALALGQAAWAGVTAYNDFGAPSLRNNSISRIGATLAELKAGNGSVIKTGTLINFTSGQTSSINLKLTVTGSPRGQAEIGADAPPETEAGTVFGEKVNSEGGSPHPAGKVQFIDLSR